MTGLTCYAIKLAASMPPMSRSQIESDCCAFDFLSAS